MPTPTRKPRPQPRRPGLLRLAERCGWREVVRLLERGERPVLRVYRPEERR